jgi:hypothetical protein
MYRWGENTFAYYWILKLVKPNQIKLQENAKFTDYTSNGPDLRNGD